MNHKTDFYNAGHSKSFRKLLNKFKKRNDIRLGYCNIPQENAFTIVFFKNKKMTRIDYNKRGGYIVLKIVKATVPVKESLMMIEDNSTHFLVKEKVTNDDKLLKHIFDINGPSDLVEIVRLETT